MASGERDYSHRSLLDKLGVGTGMRVATLGFRDAGFLTLLCAAGADVSTRRRVGCHLLFLRLRAPGDLVQIAGLEALLARDGGAWIVYEKGRKDLREADVIAAGVAAGLVDNKVVSFSGTETALRFVIPRGRR